jgi:hypothetical protein
MVFKGSNQGKNQEEEKNEQLKAMRDQLYSRSGPQGARERQTFSPVHSPPNMPPAPLRDILHTEASPPIASVPEAVPEMSRVSQSRKTPKGYRTKIIAVAVVFFVVALILSGVFLFFEQNTISGNNIAVAVQAPFTISGGEELSLQVAVTNKNTVAVESATLIVEYPPGTQEAGTTGKELFRARVPLGSIKPGEVLNTPIKAKIFGQENEEKTIAISMEYRVAGSNATFVKEADPLKITISSSPVVLSVEALKEVSSGQEVILTLSLASNSAVPLSNLLVRAEYPQGFDFSSADPKPVKGQNLWTIASVQPGGKEKLVIKGVMVGGSTEARTFNFSVGVPNERDHFNMASVLTKQSTEITLTDPFVGLTVLTNGSAERTVSVGQGNSITGSITFKNTLADSIYDGAITATLSGNGLNASAVTASQGFYNSSANTITWDKSSVEGLGELAPGAQETVTFSINGANLNAVKTPEISYTVSVAGRRVSESRVPQALTNIESRTIRFESATTLSSRGLYSIGPFTNTGPMPPKAEMATQYTIVLNTKNGSNELADAIVTMTLPSYVTWSNVVGSGDDITYNTGTREVLWRIGTLGANSAKNAAFQVSFLPSVSQVGTVPTLVGTQNLRATDRFTGTVIRSTAEQSRRIFLKTQILRHKSGG